MLYMITNHHHITITTPPGSILSRGLCDVRTPR